VTLRRNIFFPAAVFTAALCALLLPYFFSHFTHTGTAISGTYSRIVSLSPSLTKMLVQSGAAENIIGITSYDTFSSAHAVSVGTLINPSIEAIIRCRPDAVFYCDEDSAVQHMEPLASAGIRPVNFPRVRSFEDSLSILVKTGVLTGRENEARAAAERFRSAYRAKKNPAGSPQVLFLLSADPLIAASGSSFIGSLIRDAGARPAVIDAQNPYPVLSKEFVVRAAPALVFITAAEYAAVLKTGFAKFPRLPFLAEKRIIVLDPDIACLYDPEDMLATKNRIADSLGSAEIIP
jgi:iron complex transport system substrate-binding protein